VISEPGQEIHPDDIPVQDDGMGGAGGGGGATTESLMPLAYLNEPFHSAKDRLVAHFEKEYLARLTTRAAGNMSKAARLAGIDRTTLYRLLEKHEIRRDGQGEGE
jgi:DNA-binding NtrC family response regulator